MVLYDKNCRYEIYVVNESLEGNTLLFSITKTVFPVSTNLCKISTYGKYN